MPINFRKRGFFKTVVSLVRVKLVIPMIRSKNPPEITARGSMVGMAWAMTPLVGVQMYLVFMTWLFTKKVFKWDFNLPVGLAWTWVTNVFTMPPFYYAFYVTGKLMMGEFAERTTYAKFYNLIKTVLSEGGIAEALKAMSAVLIKDWGAAMMLGSIPWIIFGSWGAYAWTLWYVRRRQRTLMQRLENRQKKLEQKIKTKQEKFERAVEKAGLKMESKQQKFEIKQKKLEEKLEKTIAAREEAAIESHKENAP
ncbi:MAG: DUF2062 domain-containing protein [Alphaproteobacteria bacterium]|nr:DUF2062 domain-containing protein [Alphaproteobacteria bacterium]